MDKKIIILILGIVSLIVLNSGCTSSSTSANQFKVGNSTFQLTGDWEEGFNSNGSSASRIRLDSTGKIIIVSQYKDPDLYKVESKNADNTEKVNGTICKMIPGYPAIVWFSKNGNYYHVGVQNIDSSGNYEDGIEEDFKYIEEIVSTMQ